jgi:hypothetical protein
MSLLGSCRIDISAETTKIEKKTNKDRTGIQDCKSIFLRLEICCKTYVAK